MPVISGGLFASSVSGPYGIGDEQFLTAMYAAGAKRFMNGIGIHVYPDSTTGYASPSHMLAAVEQVLNPLHAVTRAVHAPQPLWITELGISTQSELGSPPVTEAQQAGDLVALIHRLEHQPDVAAVIIDRLIDPPQSAASTPGNAPGFGVFGVDGSPKPAACVMSAVFHGRLIC
jgi:hypothetical protein